MAYTAIDDPSAYFKVQLYSGDGTAIGSGGQVITFDDTDTDMQPDLVWVKCRSINNNHNMVDSVRGGGKKLAPNSTYFEETKTEGIASFQSDGFTVGNYENVNKSGETFVAWNWKANGAGSSNTDGSITSTVSANTTTGFSIVKWTGDDSTVTIGHGLGAVPKMIITKRYDASDNWFTYHHSLGNTKYMLLEASDAEAVSNGAWDDTSPTSSVFTKDSATNIDTGTYIAYCFAEKQGYSKFGSYTGNGNADGSFVYTGFKPAFVMLKYTAPGNGVGSWHMYDNKRKGYNVENDYVQANTTSTENSDTDQIDLLSNGFKCRATGSDSNESGSTYVYAAFAEAPFVNSNGVPCNAR